MWRMVARRLALSVPLLFLVSLLTYVLAAVAPGDPTQAILGSNYTAEGAAALRGQLGLDQPMLEQYWHWLVGALQGNLGTSPISGLDVGAAIGARIGVTLALIVGATLVAALVGVGLGVLTAVRGGALGKAVDVLSLAGFAMPSFWLALVLVTVFSVKLRLLPATGYVSPSDSVGGWLAGLILPVAALSLYGVAVVAKQTRDGMLSALAQDFVTAARARGVPERSIVFRHALRNAAIPVVTVVGLVFVGLLNATVLIEAVFAMPGLGDLAVHSTTQHDLPMIQGVAVAFTLVVVLVNLAVDVGYGFLNPKVRSR